MTDSIFDQTPLETKMNDLKKDILQAGGPRISTMRNYGFAIVQYDPREEFEIRGHIQRLSADLERNGWNILSISLKQLFLERLNNDDPEVIRSIIARERRLYKKSPVRALEYIKDEMHLYFENSEGIAGDVSLTINSFFESNPDSKGRTIVFLSRMGALYPFFRTSSLTKYIDGKIHKTPLILFYPGERKDRSTLSFMGELPADRDYRTRIYS